MFVNLISTESARSLKPYHRRRSLPCITSCTFPFPPLCSLLSFPFPFGLNDGPTAFCANPPFIRVVRIALTYLPSAPDRRKATVHVHPFCVLLLHTVSRTGCRKGGLRDSDKRVDTDLITGTNAVGAETFDAPPSSPISDEEHAKLQ